MHKDGITVAEYWTELPPKAELEQHLHQALLEAQERLARRGAGCCWEGAGMSESWESYALGFLDSMVGSGLARLASSDTDVTEKCKPKRLVAHKKRAQDAMNS